MTPEIGYEITKKILITGVEPKEINNININKIIKIISGIGLIFMVYCIVIPAILDIPTLVKQEYTVTEGIVESWNYSDEERLEERSISIKDDTGQEKSVIVYSTGIHQGEHLVVEYLPHSKYGIVKERIR